MQQTMKYALPSILLLVLAVEATIGPVPASAQSNSGQFNPQTQFPVGTKLQIESIYGLETPPVFFNSNGMGSGFGNQVGQGSGQSGYQNRTRRSGFANQQWNLTYLRSIPTANSSITLNAQVTNDTQQGSILWIVESGTIAYNGTTLTVTGGKGGIGKLNRILMVGNATDSKGNSFRWTLEGLATLYGGTAIISLTGNVLPSNQTMTSTAPQSTQDLLRRGANLTYLATITTLS